MSSHLTLEEREVISQMNYAGHKPVEIARRLGRDPGTISRELKRNVVPGAAYSACAAQAIAERRRRERPLTRKMDHPDVRAAVYEGLLHCWSPEQIAGRLKREHPHCPARRVSRQTIYDWIESHPRAVRAEWRQCLRFGVPTRRNRPERRGRLPQTVSIKDRPQVVARRERYGDWEGETVVGAAHRGAILTLVDRKSGFLLTGALPHRTAAETNAAACRLLEPLPQHLRRTVTFDNGKEFAHHQRLSQRLHIGIYFADPYCAWQRGTSENTNGLLRQFFPKGTDLRNVPDEDLQEITTTLNHRPRKRLHYRTPAEVFQSRLQCCD